MTCAVLAVQGAFIEHVHMLNALKVDTLEIRKRTDLDIRFDGLILPGGESTVMGKLLHELELFNPLKKLIENGLPVFGTCAGMILLANKLHDDKTVHFGTMDIEVKRNAYGRQLGSFNTESTFKNMIVEMPFIRAPYIIHAGRDVEVLSVVNDNIVAARQKNQLVTAFHPEVTTNASVHKYFLDMIR